MGTKDVTEMKLKVCVFLAAAISGREMLRFQVVRIKSCESGDAVCLDMSPACRGGERTQDEMVHLLRTRKVQITPIVLMLKDQHGGDESY